MNKVYKFRADWCNQCPNLDKELARIDGGLEVEVVDYATPEGEALGKKFGVRGLPTMVKTREVRGVEQVMDSVVGFQHTRATLEKFLEV